jgi:hypothetical protein
MPKRGRCGSRAGWRGTQPGYDSQPRRVDPQVDQKAWPADQLRACYEAGQTGFVLYWQLTQLGLECAVVAPTLVPKKSCDRVKTDRRDALKLARSHRSDDPTAVWVPDRDSESLRDLVRAREAAKPGSPERVFVRGVEAGSVASAAPANQVPAPHGPASPTGAKGVDGKIRRVDPAGPLHASCAGSHFAPPLTVRFDHSLLPANCYRCSRDYALF